MTPPPSLPPTGEGLPEEIVKAIEEVYSAVFLYGFKVGEASDFAPDTGRPLRARSTLDATILRHLSAARAERDEARRLDAPERTLDPQWGMDAFRAVLGDQYTPRVWGKHRALHHSSLKHVMSLEGLPGEVYDVVATLIWDCGITGNRAKFAFDELSEARNQRTAADDALSAARARAERAEKALEAAGQAADAMESVSKRLPAYSSPAELLILHALKVRAALSSVAEEG